MNHMKNIQEELQFELDVGKVVGSKRRKFQMGNNDEYKDRSQDEERCGIDSGTQLFSCGAKMFWTVMTLVFVSMNTKSINNSLKGRGPPWG